MNELMKNKSIFIVGGPGGVGKTTFASALGVQLATLGYRTLVLTVDPAKRLAQALGLDGFSSEIQAVPTESGVPPLLYASMLDSRRFIDRLIDRFAGSEQQRNRLKRNPLYRVMVESLAGTQEYAAMERLLDVVKDDRFDKIVLDTPPTENAIDLFTAPQRFADFMDQTIFRWFQSKPGAQKSLWRSGTGFAMKGLQTLFGKEFMNSLGGFFSDLEGMQSGFRERNLAVLDLLRSDATCFLLVTTPTETRFLESVKFKGFLEAQRIPLSAVVLNRLEPSCPETWIRPDRLPAEQAQKVEAIVHFSSLQYRHQKRWIDEFTRLFAPLPCHLLERHFGELHNPQQLRLVWKQLDTAKRAA